MENKKFEKESVDQIMNKGFESAGMEGFDGSYSLSSVQKGVSLLEKLKLGLFDSKSAVMTDFCEAFCVWYGNYITSLFKAEWMEDFRGEAIIWLFNNWVIDPFEEVFDYVYGPSHKHLLLERLDPANYKKHGLRPRNN